MSNTENKLDALINALGFDVVEGEVEAGSFVARESASCYTSKEINDKYPGHHIELTSWCSDFIISQPVKSQKLTPRSDSIFKTNCHTVLLAKVLSVANEVYALNLGDFEDCERFSDDEIKALMDLYE